MTDQFVKVIASRGESPNRSEISVIVGPDELPRLFELAKALPDYMEWRAEPVDSQHHRSGS